MLMVVFGAGASHDSAPDNPGGLAHIKPPLANDLFENSQYKSSILKLYKEVGSVFDLFSRSRRGDVSLEQALQQFRDGSRDDPTRLCQLAAVKFYLRDLIHSFAEDWNRDAARRSTTYMALLQQLHVAVDPKDEPILLVTFNYDTLIEDAINSRPMHQINNIDDYVRHDRFKLFKLHGSTNWGRALDLSEAQKEEITSNRDAAHLSNYYINHAATIRYLDEYCVTDHRLHQGSHFYMPALSIPLAQKEGPVDCECPPSHLETLYRFLPGVDRILTIGWSAGDTYFLSEILNPRLPEDVELRVVGKDANDALEIKDRINSRLKNLPYLYSEFGFSRFVASDDLARFLA